jgi:hypothetical protein
MFWRSKEIPQKTTGGKMKTLFAIRTPSSRPRDQFDLDQSIITFPKGVKTFGNKTPSRPFWF